MTIFWVAEREREKGRLDFSSSWIVPLLVASHMNPTMIITTEKKYKSGHYRTEVKPLLGIPTLHPEWRMWPAHWTWPDKDPGLDLSFRSIFDLASFSYTPQEATDDDLNIWAPAIHVEHTDGVLGSWLWFFRVLEIVGIWVVKKQMKDFCLSAFTQVNF